MYLFITKKGYKKLVVTMYISGKKVSRYIDITEELYDTLVDLGLKEYAER